MFSDQKPHIFLILYLLKNIQPLKWFWNYKNLIQIRILKVRVSQLENTKLFYPFQELPSRPAHTKMHNSAILTFNQCPQTCYTTTSLVNWIIKLMLKYYGSVFLFLHSWGNTSWPVTQPPEPPRFTQWSTPEPDNITKQRKLVEGKLQVQTPLS